MQPAMEHRILSEKRGLELDSVCKPPTYADHYWLLHNLYSNPSLLALVTELQDTI